MCQYLLVVNVCSDDFCFHKITDLLNVRNILPQYLSLRHKGTPQALYMCLWQRGRQYAIYGTDINRRVEK